jgi:endogenous inhibitor of DNA gyrase (YacG/DUF329 family)
MNKIIKVRCPQCRAEFSYYESMSRPFCSERCKMIDLGHWFEESYRVPLKEQVAEEDLEQIINQNSGEELE